MKKKNVFFRKSPYFHRPIVDTPERHVNVWEGQLIIDTPEKYAQLKQGHFDDKHEFVDILSGAHPDLLLQPQYFANAPFSVMRFISATNDGNNNTIVIRPGASPDAKSLFMNGENTLEGVPKDYPTYLIGYSHEAKPTAANIDTILQWKAAELLSITDTDNVAVSLLQRVDELAELYELWSLTLSLQAESHKEISVATFIEKMPSLSTIAFQANGMTQNQITAFVANNAAPDGWGSWIFNTYILYAVTKP